MIDTNNKTKILFIDDSSMMCKTISKYLVDTGYIVYTAMNGEEGIEVFYEKKPDIVLTDLKMPVMDGLTVLLNIKRDSPDIPVIIISGQGLIKDVIKALRLGAWDYITKPIEDMNILEYAIQKSLERSRLILKNRGYEKNLQEIVHQRTIELEEANKNLESMVTEIVNSLAVITEKRDPYTAGHQERVSFLAARIAEEMGLSKDKIAGIRIAGMLHDIGKIYVPAEILSKPTKLDHNEMEIIKKHCRVGYEILKNISFPWLIGDIVLQHHERLNGSGYPDSLTEKNILLEAKIIGVADVVEAMSSHRPYRASLGIKKALEEIKGKSKILFCPDCVDACVRIFDSDINKNREVIKEFHSSAVM